jgi:LCP family protein required for cell wall assembly
LIEPDDPATERLGPVTADPDPDDAPTEVVARVEEPGEIDDEADQPVEESADQRVEESADQPVEESAEPAGGTCDERGPEDGFELRARKIDESLHRLTAIHAGLGAELAERISRPDRAGAGDERPVPPAPTPPRRRPARAVVITVAVVLFAATALGWLGQAWLNGKLRPVSALDPKAAGVVSQAGQAGNDNYLLVGSTDGSADAVMLAHRPARRDRLIVVAFPRSLRVDRPSCDRWDPLRAEYPGGTTPAEAGVRLADVYVEGGPSCLTKTLERLTGVAVNHFADLDLGGLSSVVDAAPGVRLCAAGGRPPLTGAGAVSFLRAPSETAGAGDDRIAHQELLLAALLRRAGSGGLVRNPATVARFVEAFGAHSRIDNLSVGDLQSLAGTVAGLDPSKVEFTTAPDDPGAARAVFAAVRTEAPLPETSNQPSPEPNTDADATDPDTPDADASGVLAGALTADQPDETRTVGATSIAAAGVRLDVLNASSRPGLAGQAADSLRALGFLVDRVGDAPVPAGGRTVVRHSADLAGEAAALARAVPSAGNEPVPGTGVLQLVLGDGFDGQVRAAPAGAAAPPAVTTLAALASAAAGCG